MASSLWILAAAEDSSGARLGAAPDPRSGFEPIAHLALRPNNEGNSLSPARTILESARQSREVVMRTRTVALVIVMAISMLAVALLRPSLRGPSGGGPPGGEPPEQDATPVAAGDPLSHLQHQGMHFMDLLMGGPLAAQAAQRVAAAAPPAQPALQPRVSQEGGKTVREYTVDIVEKTIDYGGGNLWTVWTYNGTVPGPTFRARVGEILRIRVRNKHNRVHSLHTHLSHYPLENDGSQANIIAARAPAR
jgi:FtsP/CotA-like multicopper oxidase with cupredoxin domain